MGLGVAGVGEGGSVNACRLEVTAPAKYRSINSAYNVRLGSARVVSQGHQPGRLVPAWTPQRRGERKPSTTTGRTDNQTGKRKIHTGAPRCIEAPVTPSTRPGRTRPRKCQSARSTWCGGRPWPAQATAPGRQKVRWEALPRSATQGVQPKAKKGRGEGCVLGGEAQKEQRQGAVERKQKEEEVDRQTGSPNPSTHARTSRPLAVAALRSDATRSSSSAPRQPPSITSRVSSGTLG